MATSAPQKPANCAVFSDFTMHWTADGSPSPMTFASRTRPDSVTVTSTFTVLSGFPVLKAQHRRTSPCMEAIFAFALLGISAAPLGQRGLGWGAAAFAVGGGASLAEPPHAETKTTKIEI